MELTLEDIKLIQKFNENKELNEVEKAKVISIANQTIIEMLTKLFEYKLDKE